MRRIRSTALSMVLVAGCSAAPAVIPTKNLERPVDMTFACLKMVQPSPDGSPVLSGQPMRNCHPRDAADPTVILNGSRNLGTFSFVANSSRSELAVADMDLGRLVDLSPETAGYGLLPVGENPEALASSQDGCWVVTANKTSCDFTLVDPARLLARTFSTASVPAPTATGTGDVSRRLMIQTGSGRAIHTSTGEIAFLPSPATSTCQDDAATRPRAIATFPTCDMVALLEFSFGTDAETAGTATILSSYYVRPDLPGGFQAAGTEPVCPIDCSEVPGDDGGVAVERVDAGVEDESVDGGSVDGGSNAQAPPPSYLQPLALVPDGTRVYVGSLMDTAVTSLDINDAGLANPSRFELAENPVGVTRLRLGVDPYATTGTVQGQFLQNRGKFLYAFTRDDSVRVVEVEDGAAPQECDANIILQRGDNNQYQLAPNCFPVGSPHRRPLAQGPGIRIPTLSNPNSPPPVPIDLAFADLEPIANDANIHSLSGQFGFLLASNGLVYVINLAPKDENPITPSPTFETLACQPDTCPPTVTATNSFRDLRTVDYNIQTPIAISIAPQRSAVLTDQAFATTASFSALEGPLIKSFSYDNGATSNWLDFPDLGTVVSRSWDVVWEGVVPNTARESGTIQGAGSVTAIPAGVLIDEGANFCTSGVQAGDVLMFPGCTQNSDCQPDDKFTCQPTVSGANSMCLPIDGTASALIEKCSNLVGSRMRYEVVSAARTTLTLGLKLDEVPKTSLNPCKQDSDCRPDSDHGSLSPDGGDRGFVCRPVYPSQDPLLPPRPRCVEPCSKNSECRAGHVCAKVPGVLPDIGYLCVEAPPIDATCFSQPMTRYRVHAGQSYVVYGGSMPNLRISGVSAPASETCERDISADPSLVNRIPLSAPICPASFLAQVGSGSATFVQNLSAQNGANPCIYAGSYKDGDTTGSADAGTIRAFFQNPQIRFVLANLDKYAGDLVSIHFELRYGFIPFTVQTPYSEVLLTLGTRILTGPSKTPESPIRRTPITDYFTYPYLYVVDQGRSLLTPSSRGQVLRINPRAGSNEIATFDTTISGSTPFQLQ